MSENLLKRKAIFGVLWIGLQKFGSLAIGFIGNLFLARLLSPNDYGCIGLLLIFTNIADVLVDGGLGTALVQKKNITSADNSTVFTSNIVLSVFFFVLLFIFAPLISDFFKIPILRSVLRVESFAIVLRAFYLVQASLLHKSLAFKKMSLIMLIAQCVSVVSSIIAAYNGLGVWSLVLKNMILQGALCVLYWKYGKWKINFHFDMNSFKELFNFGFLLALSNITETFFANVESFIIGRRFKTNVLGYYSQAKSLGQMPIYSLSMIVNTVMFPVLSKINEDNFALKEASRKCLIVMTYIGFPIIILLAVLAEPLIQLLYTDKWLQSAPFLVIICITGLLNSVIHLNFTILKSMKQGSYYLKSQIYINSVKLLLILVGMYWGIMGLLIGHMIGTYIGSIILSYYSGKTMGYGFLRQFKDLIPNFTLSVILGVLFYFITLYLQFSAIYKILLVSFFFCLVYFLLSYLLKLKGYMMFSIMLKRKINL